MLQAKALYDNVAETPEELGFRRGDILTVLEQDSCGLQGWWYCTINGQRGIVPGNRLKIINRKPPPDHAAVKEALKTWHTQNKVVTPKRHGSTFIYDTPQRCLSDARNTDYDVPPSRSPSSAVTKALPRPPESDYDHPRSRTMTPMEPRSEPRHPELLQVQMSSLDHYDRPGSNRSSTISVMSSGSSLSAMSSGSCPQSSVSESQRSSMELTPHDMYDVPPAARALHSPARAVNKPDPTYDTPKPHPKYAQMAPTLPPVEDDYDVLKPVSTGNIYNTPTKDHLLACDSPRQIKPVSRNCSGDSGISLAVKNSQMLENAVNPYDSPRSSGVKPLDAEYDTPKPSRTASPLSGRVVTPTAGDSVRAATGETVSVYDVPPRVTKDTCESPPTREDPEVTRSSSGSSDSGIGPFPYEELKMELSAAMECLVGLQHCINTTCSKLLSFVHPKWRTPEHLEPRVYEIKLATVAVRKAADLFLEFAQGALVNASKSEDKKLTKRLCTVVDTLGDSVSCFTQSLEDLNKNMWPLVSLVRPEGSDKAQPDDKLDNIVRVTNELPEYVRSISGLIQGNSMHLFKRSGQVTGSTPVTSTPKSKGKSPPAIMPKPRVSMVSPEVGVPMPKFGPKSPDSQTDATTDSSPELCARDASSQLNENDYDVPKPLDSTEVQNNNKSMNGDHSIRTVPDEYDYVSLTKNPHAKAGAKDGDLSSGVVQMREKDEKTITSSAETKKEGQVRAKVVQSLFPPPDVRTSGLSETFKERLEKLQKEAEEPVKIYSDDYDVPQSRAVERNGSHSQFGSTVSLQTSDRMILQFYQNQVDIHSNILVNAIEAFIKCIDERQSPKTFIAYSKFVILAAHKIVYIGDTLTRHLINDNVRNDVMNHAYTLCELLKDTVNATKKAALDYPQVNSIQDMVDRVSEVSVAANGIKQIIARFAT